MKDEHEVKEISYGLFEVTNVNEKKIYSVDICIPICSCLAWKYTKQNKDGNKCDCKHITICKNIKNRKF